MMFLKRLANCVRQTLESLRNFVFALGVAATAVSSCSLPELGVQRRVWPSSARLSGINASNAALGLTRSALGALLAATAVSAMAPKGECTTEQTTLEEP